MDKKEYHKLYYQKNKEKRKSYQKKYSLENKDKITAKNARLNPTYRRMDRKRYDTFESWPMETCKFCGNRIIPSYNVDNEIWKNVIGKEVCVCLPCFDREAQKKKIEYKINSVFWVSWIDIE
jgi:hypothetical protein